MPRMSHGDVETLDEENYAIETVNEINESLNFPFAFVKAPDLTRFGYLFPELQHDPAHRLPESPETVAALKELGRTMSEPGTDQGTDSNIPSAYTYLGQFVDHDITLPVMPNNISLNDPNLTPLSLNEVSMIKNARVPTLDLDSVYGDAPRDGDNLMLLGKVTLTGERPPGTAGDDYLDLPREGRSDDVKHDRAARIGDGRNEENAIISQLHVAFLRAHNAIVKGRGYTYNEARSLLRQHYQWIIVHDFLKRVADPAIVDNMLANPWKVYDLPESDFFMPLEFTTAAFRFGHSMVRPAYDFNINFPPRNATLLRLFSVLGRYLTLPEKWLIEWKKFIDGGTNKARRIDTLLVEPLFTVPGLPGLPVRDEIRLTARNLLRGYLLNMPTGQAVARSLGLYVMTDADIRNAATSPEQVKVLEDSGFSIRTPLWFYILAEAKHFQKGYLGPVGSTLVAGVLIALIRRSKDSFLKIPGWVPTLAGQGTAFNLPHLLHLAGVLKID